MFGEHIGLLPASIFSRIVEAGKANPASLNQRLKSLFAAMANGGAFGEHDIAWFDGGLFSDTDVIALTVAEVATLSSLAKYDWASIEPSVFGTLFERILDPDKRSQIGAHYTSREDIETLLKPVFLAPLQREWEEVKQKCEGTLWAGIIRPKNAQRGGKKTSPQRKKFDRELLNFGERLAHVTVLDPACGSGNFLYVALHMLLDLEKELVAYAAMRGLSLIPHVNPGQLHGLEINAKAQQLAQVAIWIGFLQWMHHNGFKPPADPILRPIESIENRDAILDLSDPKNPQEPEWPEADFIVGNPPFLGNKRMRGELGEKYCEALWQLYGDRLPGMSDLCCYWFEKACAALDGAKAVRAGLLATTAIRQVGARRVLERIKSTTKIFFALSDRDWILDGASIRISMVGFATRDTPDRAVLDGKAVSAIHADLTGGHDMTVARRLTTNADLCFMGVTKVGHFDIDNAAALQLLHGTNPNGRPSSDVLRPFRNGSDLVRVCTNRWIIDFGPDACESLAAGYEKPFEYLRFRVYPERQNNGRKAYREKWWIHGEARPGFRAAVRRMPRYLGTARVAKHRVFVWLETVILPDSKVIAVAFFEDWQLGILQSSTHTIWSLATCGWHGVGNDATYNPTSCFETFPFCTPDIDRTAHIALAARELDDFRSRWLNPPEWTKSEVLEFPGSADGPWARYVHDPDARGIGTVRWPRLTPKDVDCAESLKSRTLTNLYNERPTWLDLAHKKLDAAVFAAYGWDPDISDEKILERLLALNLKRSAVG